MRDVCGGRRRYIIEEGPVLIRGRKGRERKQILAIIDKGVSDIQNTGTPPNPTAYNQFMCSKSLEPIF